LRGSVKCRDAATRSALKLMKRSASLFFKVRISVKNITFTETPTAANSPFAIRLQTPSDNLDRRDDIGSIPEQPCVDRPGGTAVMCREVPK
jgi:hypothetical protein